MSDQQIEAGKVSREVSTIQFPYLDLADGITVAEALLKAGGVPCSKDQLAAAMGVPMNSNFTLKIGTARMFGLIETGSGKVQLTELGFAIADKDEARVRAAKVDAFLNVPLYRKAFEEFRGKQLPPRPLGLEQAFVNFGVSPKQKDRARQAFDRSAEDAGFFPSGARDRLVRPILISSDTTLSAVPLPPASLATTPASEQLARMTPFDEPPRRHLLIEGLLAELPEANEGWPIEDQARWLQAAAHIFGLLYKKKKNGEGETDKRTIAVTLAGGAG